MYTYNNISVTTRKVTFHGTIMYGDFISATTNDRFIVVIERSYTCTRWYVHIIDKSTQDKYCDTIAINSLPVEVSIASTNICVSSEDGHAIYKKDASKKYGTDIIPMGVVAGGNDIFAYDTTPTIFYDNIETPHSVWFAFCDAMAEDLLIGESTNVDISLSKGIVSSWQYDIDVFFE